MLSAETPTTTHRLVAANAESGVWPKSTVTIQYLP